MSGLGPCQHIPAKAAIGVSMSRLGPCQHITGKAATGLSLCQHIAYKALVNQDRWIELSKNFEHGPLRPDDATGRELDSV